MRYLIALLILVTPLSVFAAEQPSKNTLKLVETSPGNFSYTGHDECMNRCGDHDLCKETTKGDWVCIKNKTAPHMEPNLSDALDTAQVLIYRGQNLRFPKRLVMDKRAFIFYGSLFGICFLVGLFIRYKKPYFSVMMSVMMSLYVVSAVLLYDELQGMFNYYIVLKYGIASASHIIFILLAYGTVAYIGSAFAYHVFKLSEGELTPLMVRFMEFIDKNKSKFNL